MKSIQPNQRASLFTRNIVILERAITNEKTILPFFADGYPGLMFHITPDGLWVQPNNKKMPVTFLYGQTINPIELHIQGAYKIIVFRLYPYVLRSFFGVDPAELNDTCYDLSKLDNWKVYEAAMLSGNSTDAQVGLIQQFLEQVFSRKKQQLDFVISDALHIILNNKAQLTVTELCEQLHLTVRTFERRFLKEVGIPAKDFIQITKFQQSLEQLTLKKYNKLTDIVYANGFADQSHFIRVFKAFTGKTPARFAKQ